MPTRTVPKPAPDLKTWRLVWSPEGRTFDTVYAVDRVGAMKQVRQPYRKYIGEVYAEEIEPEHAETSH
jgi:hypothetical protein